MYLIKLTPEVDEALNLSGIASQHWFQAIVDYCVDTNQDEGRYFKDTEYETRQKILREFCARGPSDYLRRLLAADALFQGEYVSVHQRARERLLMLTGYVEEPPNERFPITDRMVIEAKRKLEILIAFMKDHLMWEGPP